MMFLDCPAFMDEDGATRCALPAEVRCRYVMRSSDAPLESAMIRCPAGHWFNGPVEFLTWDRQSHHDPAHSPAGAERAISRPHGAPAYYLGRPAWLWLAATRPRRRRTAPDHLMVATGD